MPKRPPSADLRAITTAIENEDVPGFAHMLRIMDQDELKSVADEIRYKLTTDQKPLRNLLLQLINDQIERRKKEAL